MKKNVIVEFVMDAELVVGIVFSVLVAVGVCFGMLCRKGFMFHITVMGIIGVKITVRSISVINPALLERGDVLLLIVLFLDVLLLAVLLMPIGLIVRFNHMNRGIISHNNRRLGLRRGRCGRWRCNWSRRCNWRWRCHRRWGCNSGRSIRRGGLNPRGRLYRRDWSGQLGLTLRRGSRLPRSRFGNGYHIVVLRGEESFTRPQLFAGERHTAAGGTA